MTPTEFKSIRLRAGLSVRQLAKLLRITERAVRYIEDDKRPISGPVSLLMELLDKGLLRGNLVGVGERERH
jgi:DNA-binding transcriptional regulator YiaG